MIKDITEISIKKPRRFPDRCETPEEWKFRAEMVTLRYLAWRIFQAVKHFPAVTTEAIEASKIAAGAGMEKLIQRGYIDFMEGGDDEVLH